MTPDVSVIVVNYRSAEEAGRCVGSLREELKRADLSGEILLVDCGSGPEEAARLRAGVAADEILLLEENRGYSGGLNAGLERARAGQLLLSNADVVYLPGALPALLSPLEARSVGATAPLCFWDAAGRLRLPPGFAPGFFRDLAQLLPGSWPRLQRRLFAAYARETWRLWERGGPTDHLSGAVLAARREVFDRVGGFDERFLFEYEETDWEERVRAAGFDLLFVPAAKVRHLWATSAARNPETGARRAVSQRVYRERKYGRLGRALLESAGRRPKPLTIPRRTELPSWAAQVGRGLAISPNPSRRPFVGVDLAEEFRLPSEFAARLSPGPWFFTVFRTRDGRPLESFVWERNG